MKYEIAEWLNSLATGYNYKRYWKMHYKIEHTSTPKILRFWYLYKIKRIESKQCCSLGHRLYEAPHFEEPPRLPHGLRGIFISTQSTFGKGCCIYQQVTVAIKGPWQKGAPHFGDNVLIGAGAKVIGDIHIGNNVKIGAGAVVTHDVPDNSTVVGNPAKVIRTDTKAN